MFESFIKSEIFITFLLFCFLHYRYLSFPPSHLFIVWISEPPLQFIHPSKSIAKPSQDTHLPFPWFAPDYLACAAAPLLSGAKHYPLNPSVTVLMENKRQSLVYSSITFASRVGKRDRKRKVFDFTCLLCSLIIIGIYGSADPRRAFPTRLLCQTWVES